MAEAREVAVLNIGGWMEQGIVSVVADSAAVVSPSQVTAPDTPVCLP